MITLDIVSDPICPWCYIGKTRLDQALAEVPEPPFEIHWRPFQLNPDMPPEGMDRRSYLEAKFGKAQAAEFYTHIARTAAEAGLEVDFEAIARTPNTIDAHRLIRWARSGRQQGAVIDEMFLRYFARGQDISDHGVLCEIAEAAGMDRDLVARLLDSDADIEEVRGEDAMAREMGIRGVPTFILDGRYMVSGAQESTVWQRIIAELAAVPT